MKLLGIHGSPRRGGNSDLLLEQALSGAREAGADVEVLRASDLHVSGCRACGSCDRTGECVQEDEMGTIYPLLRAADRIILAAPMFFYSFPSQLKALIDRSQACWAARRLHKSPEERKRYDSGTGYLIAVGATRGKNLFEGAELTARYFFDALDMKYGGGLFFRGVDEKGAIRGHHDALKQAHEFGKNCVQS